MQRFAVTEYQSTRVLTTHQIAQAYETDAKVISNNFNRNKERYVEGKHFIRLEGEEKKEFLNLHQIEDGSKKAKTLYLWTEKGAFLHAKSLNTDVAWEVYDRLVDSYFNNKKQPLQPMPELSPQLQLLINMELKQKEQDAKLAALEQRSAQQTEILKTIKDTLTDKPADFRRWAAKSIGEIANSPSFDGMYNKFQRAWTESYERLMEKLSCDLDQMVKDARKEAEKNGASKTAIRDISRVALIAEDSSLKEVYIGVVKDMLIAYCGEVV